MKNNKIGIECYCRECEHTERTDKPLNKCTECGSTDISNSEYITCSCGTTVYLDEGVNECGYCGSMYNEEGKKLSFTH